MQTFLLILLANAIIYGVYYFAKWRKQQVRIKKNRDKWTEIRRQRLAAIEENKRFQQRKAQKAAHDAAIELPKPDPKALNPHTARYQTGKPPAPKPVNPVLISRLDALTRSPATSTRLVDGLAQQYPGRSRSWLTEKAISDLERDRHRR